MSSFPISITWQVATPPTGSFDQLASAAQKLDSALQASGQKFDQFGSTIEKLESPLGSVGSSMGELGDNMEGLDSSIGSSGDAMDELAGATEDLNGSIGETGGFIQDAAGGMDELSTGAEGAGGALEDMSGSLETTNTGLEDTTTALGETVPALEDTTTGLEDTNTALEDTVPALEDTNTALEDTVPALEDTATALEDTVPAAEDTGTAFEDAVPAIEDTTTALEDTAPALEETNTALGDMGTAIEGDVTAADDFSGALGGMNDANADVSGGLTTNNTLMGNLAGTTNATAGSTNNLNGSFGRVALGMAGAAGAGVALFNMWDAVGDAQVAVDAANIRLERSQTMVDKAMLAMSRTLGKLNGDMSLGVNGLGEYNAAFSAFNGLVESGVQSGAAYDAALLRLQTAFRGLSSDTAEGERLITQLGIQMDTASQKIGLTAVASNNAANALEAKNEAMTNLAFNTVPTAIAGIGSLATTITDIPKAAHGARLALVAVSGALGTTLVPALIAAKVAMITMAAAIAPIAIPIGIVVVAIGLFVAAVTAIRANLKVFDDLGAKVGDIFPEMRGFLDDTRQAFINLSDGLNTAISVALGAIDQMTGGVANLQAQWDGFANTLPKGTGELGLAGQAMGQLGQIMNATGEQINIGAGKWENMNGTLVAFGGAVKVAAGGWYELSDGTAVYSKSANEGTSATVKLAAATDQATTAMDAYGATGQSTNIILKKQSANYSELSNAQKLTAEASNTMIEGLSKEKEERYKTFLVAQQYLRQIEKITPAVGLSMAAITGMAQGLGEQAGAQADAVIEASAYIATHDLMFLSVKRSDDEIIKHYTALKEQEKALGKTTDAAAKHVEELTKLKQAHADATAEIVFYSDATNMATRMQLEFQAGVDEANLKVIDQQAAIAKSSGELTRNIEYLKEGTLQELAYAEGVNEALNAVIEKVLALEKAEAAYDVTNALMKEGGLQALFFAEGLQETKTAIQEATLELVKLAGAQEAYADAATATRAINNEMISGYLEHRQSLIDLALAYANNIGAIAGLRQELTDTTSQMIRWNAGVMEGRRSALEFLVGLVQAKGEAAGFRDELVEAAQKIPGAMRDMSSQSVEQIQRFIQVVQGVPDAFEDVIGTLEGFTDSVISALSKAGEEGKNAFMDNIEAMEDELGVQFSKPLTRSLEIVVEQEQAKKDVQILLGVLGAAIAATQLSPTMDTSGIMDAISLIENEISGLGAISQAEFQPLLDSLDQLKQWDPGTGIQGLAPILANIASGAEAMGGPMQGLINSFGQIPAIANASATELEVLKGAFSSVGLTLDTLSGQVTDANGNVVGNIKSMSEGAQDPLAQLGASILGTGQAAVDAKVKWATEMVLMKEVIAKFVIDSAQLLIGNLTAWTAWAIGVNQQLLRAGQAVNLFGGSLMSAFARDISTHLTTASGHFNTFAQQATQGLFRAGQAANTFASALMGAFARDVQTNLTKAQTAFATFASQVISRLTSTRSSITTFQNAVTTMASQGASRVSSFASSFSSAMSKVGSSAASATSKVKALQSSINALKSKTITLTTIIRTVRQTVYAAQGGSFIQSNPGKVGPLSVSEFGQRELVTVTPLETPSRNAVKGISSLIQDAAEKKRRRAMDEDKGTGESRPSRGKEVVMVREAPIIIQVDGREITRVVNKRMFEESDALT